jgi:hypothetical protein
MQDIDGTGKEFAEGEGKQGQVAMCSFSHTTGANSYGGETDTPFKKKNPSWHYHTAKSRHPSPSPSNMWHLP